MNDVVRNRVITGDASHVLASLPAASIDCVITSPPYFLLRDYGVGGQIGHEDSVELWVDALLLAMRGVARVLKPTGSAWLNVADSYSRHPRYGAPAKSLLLGPERLALGLLADGWTIRNRVAWSKPNAMPASVTDRLNATWELLYLLTRERRYFFDLDAIRVPHRSVGRPGMKTKSRRTGRSGPPPWAGPLAGSNVGLARLKDAGLVGHPLGANPGDAWNIPTTGYRGAHFATFPERLVERPLLATCPRKVCTSCGAPWRPDRARDKTPVDLRPGCDCHAGWRPGLVLDPFFGSGTVGVVAERHGRDWLGIELNPEFVRLAEARIADARSPDDEVRRAA